MFPWPAFGSRPRRQAVFASFPAVMGDEEQVFDFGAKKKKKSKAGWVHM